MQSFLYNFTEETYIRYSSVEKERKLWLHADIAFGTVYVYSHF